MMTYTPDLLTAGKPKTECGFCGKTIKENARHWIIEMADGTDSPMHLKCYASWKGTN